MTRPKLAVEKLEDKEITHAELNTFLFDGAEYQFPHCDARILHLPEECEYCAKATELQEERERLEVSNSGHQNRKWPCPVERARSLKGAHKWHGNRPTKEGEESDPFGLLAALDKYDANED